MDDLELTADGGRLLGSARIDPTVEPFPRAVLTPAFAAPPADLADVAMAAMPGHRLIVDDAALAEALIDRAATLVRAASLMVVTLPVPSPGSPTPGVELRPLQDTPHEYGEVMRRAYPPDHPDHEHGDATPEGARATIRGYLSGEIVGPVIAEASAEAGLDGVLVGVAVVSEMPADDEFDGGPWITDLFVDPAAQGRGVGKALLGLAIERLTAAGRPTLGLAVTLGNPARRLYESLGFVDHGAFWNLINEA
jgi:GNAT superfamily N-acetyltransferase